MNIGMNFTKKMKGFIGVILCLFLMTTPKIAFADVIWEPNDDFYLKHSDECALERRNYISNRTDGKITLYKSPLSKKKVGTYSEEEYYVSFTFTDKNDVKWGIIEVDGKTGWIPMDQLIVVYDNQSFYEDYYNEFKNYDGTYDEVLEDSFIIWTFPGSGEIDSKFMEENKAADSRPEIQYTFTDDEGRAWGYVNYYYGSRGWICLDDPVNENIPLFGKHTLNTITPSIDANSLEQDYVSEWIYPVVFVVAVVILTLLLIKKLYKKENSSISGNNKG